MRPVSASRLAIAAALLAALAWSLLLGLWHLQGRATLLDRIEFLTLDLRFMTVGRRPPPSDLVIVGIDDETLRAVGQYPLPRTVLAELLRRIEAQDPAVLALDMLLIESRPEADAELRRALAALPSVIGAAALFGSGDRTGAGPDRLSYVPRADSILWPTEELRDAAAIGLVNVSSDSGGTPRHIPLLIRSAEGLSPSFALLAAALALPSAPSFADGAVVLAGRPQALDLGYHLALNFYGPRGTLPVISAAQVLRGELPPGLLRGRTIIVGATAIGSGDTFATPFSPVMPGVEVLATAIGNLMADEGLIRTPTVRWIDAVAAGLLALSAVLLISLRRTTVGLLSVAALAAAWTGFAVVAFFQGYWFSIALPLATTAPTAILYGAARLGLDRLRIAQLSKAERELRAFHPPAFAQRLADDPGFLAAPLQQNAAVLFVDLSGFTGASEALGALRTRELLKGFHSVVDEEVSRQGGFVAAFMGDGAMVLFGFPDRGPGDGASALKAALGLRERLIAWSRRENSGPGGPLAARIGAHFGPVIISRLGGRSHQHITATGDTVNVTSRLLDLAKQMQVPIVVTEDLFAAAIAADPAMAAGFSPPTLRAIRGRRGVVAVRGYGGAGG